MTIFGYVCITYSFHQLREIRKLCLKAQHIFVVQTKIVQQPDCRSKVWLVYFQKDQEKNKAVACRDKFQL